MRRKIFTTVLIGTVMALSACGNTQDAVNNTTESVAESTESSGGSVSLDASGDMQESSETEETASRENPSQDVPPEDAEATDAAPVERPDTIKFVIVQDVRDGMFTLSNAEDQTLTIDSSADAGYTGTLKPSAGEYVTGESGYYTLPYSSSFTISDMDDGIVYVSAEYPYVVSVAVQNASVVTMNDDRSVVILGKDNTTVFSYHVWLPSLGVTKESQNEVMTGQGAGDIKLYWDGSKIAVQQLSGSEVSTDIKSEDSDVATVDWRTACPWADKIATGVWSDGADLSNVKQLKEGIMSAKFTPVDEITEDAKVVNLTFYDTDKKKIGVLKFWQKGNHVEIDGNKFDYDTFGLE